MNYRPIVLAALLGTAGTCALAEVNVSIGLPGPVYVQPAPLYAPPPVYAVPRPVYAPRPVVVVPPPMYAPRWRGDDDDYDEWRKWHKRHYKQQRKKWRREWDDDDD